MSPTDYTQFYLVRTEPEDDDQTPAKDDAADQVEELWGLSLSQIAELSGYSRQHIKNTLDHYFNRHQERPDAETVIEPTADYEGAEPPADDTGLPLDVPGPVSSHEDFLRGYTTAMDIDDFESFLIGYYERIEAER